MPMEKPVKEPTAQDRTDVQTLAADGAVPVDAVDVPVPVELVLNIDWTKFLAVLNVQRDRKSVV